MNEIYKGYLASRNKLPIGDVNDRSALKTLAQIKDFDPEEYIGVLEDDYVMLEFNNKSMASTAAFIAMEYELGCKVFTNEKSTQIIFKKDEYFNYATTNKQIACGLVADLKLGEKNCTQVLKYKGEETGLIIDNEVEEAPFFFRPCKYAQTSNINLNDLTSDDNRENALAKHVHNLLKIMDKDKIKETLLVINEYVFQDMLDVNTVEKIYAENIYEDTSRNSFFDKKGKFLFDKFSNYLMNTGKFIRLDNNLRVYKDGIYINGEDWIEREMIKKIPDLGQAKRKEVISYLKLLIEENVNSSEYNHLIAFRNGVYNIFTGEFSDFNENYVITNKINWDYNPDAYSQTVDSLFTKLSCDDANVRAILEEMVGYCFFRQNELGKAFILVGPQANGKSTIQALLQKLFGIDNITSLDLKDLGSRFKTAELYSKLANIGDDIGDAFIDDNNVFKTIVTGGRLTAERKGKDPFEFEPYVKCIFSANNIPKTRDKTGAIKRRLIIVPFDRVFSPKDPDFDPYIKYKLINGSDAYTVDDNMSYLINLGIAGLKRVLENNGFTQSERVNDKISEYDKENNPIKLWFDELSDAKTYINGRNTQEVYNAYCDFCIVNGLKEMGKIEFSKSIKNEFGFDTKSTSIGGQSIRIYTK